ncbi:MAG TPA: hypothetical protein VM600_00015, partial [Actinomycetota bacterium]|nr:hypothetical protein [Actinomycetota bacterium]
RARLRPLGSRFGFEGRAESNGFTITLDNGFNVVARRERGKLVLASNRAYAQQLLNPGSAGLGDDLVYKRVFDDTSDKVAFQMYVRIDRVRQIVEAFTTVGGGGGDDYEKNVAPLIRPFEAFGMRATIDGDEGAFRIVLTLADR